LMCASGHFHLLQLSYDRNIGAVCVFRKRHFVPLQMRKPHSSDQ
jgi:hypothetical protein